MSIQTNPNPPPPHRARPFGQEDRIMKPDKIDIIIRGVDRAEWMAFRIRNLERGVSAQTAVKQLIEGSNTGAIPPQCLAK